MDTRAQSELDELFLQVLSVQEEPLYFLQSRKKLSLGPKCYKTVIFLEGTGAG